MKVEKIVKILREFYKGKEIEWSKGLTPFQILVGTVISQRTKDSTTEKIVKKLFLKYPDAFSLSRARHRDVEKLIYGAGFYKQKAKKLIELSKILVEKYSGEVPKSREELEELPGVGPKTSGIVMVYAFGKNVAIPVDVHVHRISNRIGLVRTKTPEETEKKLMEIIPKRYWKVINHLLVIHGQNICLPRNPKCDICPIKNYCLYYKNHYK